MDHRPLDELHGLAAQANHRQQLLKLLLSRRMRRGFAEAGRAILGYSLKHWHAHYSVCNKHWHEHNHLSLLLVIL
jgi:hypothetical protein